MQPSLTCQGLTLKRQHLHSSISSLPPPVVASSFTCHPVLYRRLFLEEHSEWQHRRVDAMIHAWGPSTLHTGERTGMGIFLNALCMLRSEIQNKW